MGNVHGVSHKWEKMVVIMTIKLYTNSSDNFTLQKKITQVAEFGNVLLLDNTNIINPAFRLVGLIDDFAKINYCYVPEFNRYYYVVTVEILAGGIIELQCAIDVLMTYREQILNTTAVITRGGKNYNVLVNDGQKIAQANTAVVNKKFTGGELLSTITSENNSFLLTCYGGIV